MNERLKASDDADAINKKRKKKKKKIPHQCVASPSRQCISPAATAAAVAAVGWPFDRLSWLGGCRLA